MSTDSASCGQRPDNSPADRFQRRALCVGLSQFGPELPPEMEPPADAWEPLGFAVRASRELAAALTESGFECTVRGQKELPTAKALGSEVLTAATEGPVPAVAVVHVLSHGYQGKSGVHVVGADGKWDSTTRVANWVAAVEDHSDPANSPHCLFVVDTCYSGQAADLDWLPAANEDTKAWVIAAAQPGALAFDGRLTTALTTVLRRIQSGDLDFSPSQYVPFVHLVEQVGQEVSRLGGEPQHVTGTATRRFLAPPLIVNPRRSRPGAEGAIGVDPLIGPFADLDVALDPAHFLDRAAGHREIELRERIGCFTGRGEQIAQLCESLAGHPSGLTVVTGGAGSGKSALLGVLVCALHPKLRKPTEYLWQHVAVPDSAWGGALAAVHLRERTLTDATAALVRQLDLSVGENPEPEMVVTAVTHMPEAPLLVFDALDEAADQDAVLHRLLLPLASATRPDESFASTLWVGTRPWDQFADLLESASTAGHLMDLDQITTAELERDIEDYVSDLLTHAPVYRGRGSANLESCLRLARGTAQALSAPERDRGGEFLTAALYTHWLLRQAETKGAVADPAEMLERVPRSIAEALDLDLDTRADKLWLTAVLTAAGHALGSGMPATVLRRCAPAFHPTPDHDAIPVELFDRLLRQVRFYLRSSPDTDGTTLYRLFHKSLNDHLVDPEAHLDGFVDRLLEPVLSSARPTDPEGRLRVQAAEPYVQRHWVQHAADAGRLELLIQHDPKELHPIMNIATRTRQGRLGAAIYRQSADHPAFGTVTGRRQLLAIEAARYGAPEICQRLSNTFAKSAPRPLWSTGGSITPQLRMVLNSAPVDSVAIGRIAGRTVVVSSGANGFRVWDASTGTMVGQLISDHYSTVTSVAIGHVEDRPIIVYGSSDTTVRRWDPGSGTQIGEPLTGDTGVVTVALGQIKGRQVIVSGHDDGSVRVWNAATGALHAIFPTEAWMKPVAFGHVKGRPVVVSGDDEGGLVVWDAASGDPIKKLLAGHGHWVEWVAIGPIEEPSFIVSVCSDESSHLGNIHVWDATTGTLIAEPPFEGALSIAVGRFDGRNAFITGTADQTVRTWDLTSGALIGKPLTGHTSEVTSVAVGDIGAATVIVSGDADGSVRIWDGPRAKSVGTPQIGHTGLVTGLAVGWMSGRPVVVSVSRAESVLIWDATTGSPIGAPLIDSAGATSIVIGQIDGRDLIIASTSDSLRMWDAHTGKRTGAPLIESAGVTSLALRRIDGRDLIVASISDSLRMWDANTGNPIQIPLVQPEGLPGLTERHGGVQTLLISGDPDCTRVWDIATGTVVERLPTDHTGRNDPVALGHIAGRTLIIHAGYARMGVWDFSNNHALGGPLEVTWATSVAIGQIGGRALIACGSDDCTVRLWHCPAKKLGQAEEWSDLWRPGPAPGVTTTLTLPEPVNTVAIVPDLGVAVGYGNDVAVFRL